MKPAPPARSEPSVHRIVPTGPRSDRHAFLRARIAAIERRRAGGGGGGLPDLEAVVPLGIEEVDASLPHRGILRGSLHEVAAAADDGACIGEDAAAAGFCAMLLARLGCGTSGGRPVLWCENRSARGRGGRPGGVYAPGLSIFGLHPETLILTEAGRDAEALWVAEEALRTPALAAVVAEVGTLGLVESRRLQLAAEARGVTAILLRPGGVRLSPTAAATRWRVAALAAAAPPAKRPGWALDLLRSRGGRPGTWRILWQDVRGGLVPLPLPHTGAGGARTPMNLYETPSPQRRRM